MYGRKLKCCNPVKNPWMTILNKTNSPPKWNCLTVSVDLVIPKKWLSSRCMQFNSNVLSKSIPICFPSHDTQMCFPNKFQSAFKIMTLKKVLSKSISICFPIQFQSAFQIMTLKCAFKINYNLLSSSWSSNLLSSSIPICFPVQFQSAFCQNSLYLSSN